MAGPDALLRRVIEQLRDHPAYLLVAGVMVVGLTALTGFFAFRGFDGRPELLLAGVVLTMLVLMGGALVAIRVVEPVRVSGAGHLETLDQEARDAFHEGPPAKDLAGIWHVTWYQGEGKGRTPFASADGRPFPTEEVRVMTSGPRITTYHFDPVQGQNYWMDGRISDQRIATFVYWSRPLPGFRDLTGVVFLRVDDEPAAKASRMSGWWIGHTANGKDRDARIVRGEVEWHRVPVETPLGPVLQEKEEAAAMPLLIATMKPQVPSP